MWLFQMIYNSIIKPGRGKRVFVGVSGGVDSSVSALLLKLYGYDVAGVFIRTWQPDWIQCTWRNERRDAMRVCAHLEIPFIELDLEQQYKNGVADYMITEYKKGRTPNPDVMCNREVKFGGFLDYAKKRGADYIATGHYAQNIYGELVKGKDPSKDQSYFLWTLSDEQLKYVLFPVGHLPKKVTRILARWYRLPTAVKKDSQGICFIGMIDMKEFLQRSIPQQPGDVIDEFGNSIGVHDGAVLYTLGERHGFTITEKGTNDQPYYVIAKDITANTITVTQHLKKNNTINNTVFVIDDVVLRNFDPEKAKSGNYTAQIRYHGEQKTCTIDHNESGTVVTFSEGDATVAPGQSIVLYDADRCIGGGIVR